MKRALGLAGIFAVGGVALLLAAAAPGMFPGQYVDWTDAAGTIPPSAVQGGVGGNPAAWWTTVPNLQSGAALPATGCPYVNASGYFAMAQAGSTGAACPTSGGGGGGGGGLVLPGAVGNLGVYQSGGVAIGPLVTGAGVNAALGAATNGANGLVVQNGSGAVAIGGVFTANGGVTTTGTIKGTLDPQTLPAIQVTPNFCPYNQLDGTTSNDACVQAAVDYACNTANNPAASPNVGGELVFARAKYHLAHIKIPIACGGLTLVGQGAGANGTAFLSDTTCTGPILDFYWDGTANYAPVGGGVRNILFFNNLLTGGGFSGSTSCTAYPLIQARFGRNMEFRHLGVLSPNVFMRLVSGLHPVIDDIAIDQALANSPGVFDFYGYGTTASSSASTRQDDIHLTHVMSFGAAAAAGQQWYRGIWWHGLSNTLNLDSVAFETASMAYQIDCTNPAVAVGLRATDISACPQFGFFRNIQTECTGSNCMDIEDAQSIMMDQLYLSCFARTSTSNPSTSGCNNALDVKNTQFTSTGGITINGGQISGAQGAGLEYEGYQLSVSGVHFYGNDAASVSTADIVLDAPVGSNVSGSHTITGNFFCAGPQGNSIAELGVRILGADYITIVANNFRTCGAATFGSPGAHGVLQNNTPP